MSIFTSYNLSYDDHWFRSFATPPKPVKIVCECVAMILGATDISWKGAKGVMSDPNFLRTLQTMNVNLITQKQQQMVKKHMEQTKKFAQMQTISKAGFGLYKFLLAVLDYCVVYKNVRLMI